MGEGQTDIGYDTASKKWFLAFRSKNRWNLGQQFVEKANIHLHNVEVDTLCWFDEQNQNASHGRLRFYGDNEVTAKGSPIPDDISVRGRHEKLQFSKVVAKTVSIKYVIDGMMWDIEADEKHYLTRDIKGCVNGTFSDQPIRFMMHNVTFLHSELVTLFNANLILE